MVGMATFIDERRIKRRRPTASWDKLIQKMHLGKHGSG